MTNSEAIEWLKYNKEELERFADEKDGKHASVLNPTIEALGVAIAALEKNEGVLVENDRR